MQRSASPVPLRHDHPNESPADQGSVPDLVASLRAVLLRDAAPGDADAPALAAGGIGIAASLLWSRFLRFDAADPSWPDRDRFVLSSGRFLPLLRALLRLTGHDEVPEGCAFGRHPAIETADGPPGQGFATAVGMAVAERALAGRFGRTLVDHRTWVLACETDLAAGVSLEAASLAGRIGLDKLVVLSDAAVAGPGNENEAATRFAASGWAVRRVAAGSPDVIAAAIAGAVRNRRPTLIACQPADPAPFRPASLRPAPFRPAPTDDPAWRAAGQRGAPARRSWLRRLARHRLRPEFERALSGRLPPGWERDWRSGGPATAAGSTLAAARAGLERLCARLPETVTLHSRAGTAIVDPLADHDASFPGRALRQLGCGVQEHGMAALCNGLSLHGGSRPVLGASLVSIDRMRPALRLAALMAQPVIYLLTDDGPSGGTSGGNGGWQPVEQLASLRAMPEVALFRPADPEEMLACWELALRRDDGPSLVALCSLEPPRAGRAAHAAAVPDPGPGCARGGYVRTGTAGGRDATLIATGPEVAVAMAGAELLERAGIAVAVVSLPCWELFAGQPASYREAVLGTAPRIGIEAASGFGWERWLGSDGVFIGLDGFGARAPASAFRHRSGLSPEAVAARVRRRLER